MATHRLALYSVKVHTRGLPDDLVNLGDYDDSGAWLGDLLEPFLEKLDWHEFDDDGNATGVLRTRNLVASDDDVVIAAALQTGEAGVTSDIHLVSGEIVHREEADIEYIKAFVAFRLPRGQKLGAMGVVIPHGRGVKKYLDEAMRALWESQAKHDDLMLKVNPIVPAGVLEAAAAKNAIQKVRLIKYARSADTFSSRAKWGTPESLGNVEVVFHRKRLQYLRGKPILDYLHEELSYGDLVEFEGTTFDEVKVEVETEPGRRRTISVADQSVGHAITFDIDAAELQRDDGGEPTDQALLAAALEELAPVAPG